MFLTEALEDDRGQDYIEVSEANLVMSWSKLSWSRHSSVKESTLLSLSSQT